MIEPNGNAARIIEWWEYKRGNSPYEYGNGRYVALIASANRINLRPYMQQSTTACSFIYRRPFADDVHWSADVLNWKEFAKISVDDETRLGVSGKQQKIKLMLTRREKTYSSSRSVV